MDVDKSVRESDGDGDYVDRNSCGNDSKYNSLLDGLQDVKCDEPCM